MTDFSRVKQNLEARGFRVSVFATAAEAADYLDSAIDNTSVGFGGSVTLEQMGLMSGWSGMTGSTGTGGPRLTEQTPGRRP